MMPEANMASKEVKKAEKEDSAKQQDSIPHERIAMRAYEKWCKRGRLSGTVKEDWLEAEAELRAERAGEDEPFGDAAAISHERIAMRAYEKWCSRGRPSTALAKDWLEAEAELRAESMKGERAGEHESFGDTAVISEEFVVIGSPKSLIKKLSDKDESVREEAIAKLTFFGWGEVLLAVISALNDDSPKVRAMAREHFFAVHSHFPFSPSLRKYLESDEREDRLQGIQDIVRTLPGVREAIVEHRPGWEAIARWMSSTAKGSREVFGSLEEDPMEPRQGQPSPKLVTYISQGAYLRSVWAVIWSAIRYPLSTTLIDLSTGQAVHIKADPAKTEAPSRECRPV
jgi:hypothetical protein